jgi:hypothetical protein
MNKEPKATDHFPKPFALDFFTTLNYFASRLSITCTIYDLKFILELIFLIVKIFYF